MKPLACGISCNLSAPSRILSRGINCAPAAATAVTPTSPPSMAATSTLHHWYVKRIAVSSSPLGASLGSIQYTGAADLPSAQARRARSNAAHFFEPLAPNAAAQARQTAGARDERTLFAVACSRLLGDPGERTVEGAIS